VQSPTLLAQLVNVGTGEGLHPAAGDYATLAIAECFPGNFKTYMSSRESRGKLVHPRRVQALDGAVLIVSVICIVLVAGRLISDGRWLPLSFITTVALAVLFHAFVAGAISRPLDRYGSRIIRLLPLIAFGSWRHLMS